VLLTALQLCSAERDLIFTVFQIGETEILKFRMTIVTEGEDKIMEQVVKQLNRLIDTIKVIDLTGQTRVERELALITVFYQKEPRRSYQHLRYL